MAARKEVNSWMRKDTYLVALAKNLYVSLKKNKENIQPQKPIYWTPSRAVLFLI
jgi:hypothetical protein